MGIPRSWEFQERVPQRGTFKCAYVCAPDERNWEYRKKLFECFALTELRVSEKEVNWWTNVHEARLCELFPNRTSSYGCHIR